MSAKRRIIESEDEAEDDSGESESEDSESEEPVAKKNSSGAENASRRGGAPKRPPGPTQVCSLC